MDNTLTNQKNGDDVVQHVFEPPMDYCCSQVGRRQSLCMGALDDRPIQGALYGVSDAIDDRVFLEVPMKAQEAIKYRSPILFPKGPTFLLVHQQRAFLQDGFNQEVSKKEDKKHKAKDTQEEGAYNKDPEDPNPPQTTTDLATTPLSVNPINVVPPLISTPPITQIPLFLWSHDVAGTDLSIDSAFDIVPPPLLQKVREKRKGQLTPKVQVLDNTLTTQSTRDLISGTVQELAMRVEELELELVLQAHRAREESEALNLSLNTLMKESCLGENDKSGHWRERARALAGRANAILEDKLPMTSSTQSDVQELIPSICSLKILPQEMSQVEFRMRHAIARSSGQELQTGKSLEVLPFQNSLGREVSCDSLVPTRDLGDLVHDISSTLSLDVPPIFSISLVLPRTAQGSPGKVMMVGKNPSLSLVIFLNKNGACRKDGWGEWME
eukprot:Gb_15056 [translate_table: standard]